MDIKEEFSEAARLSENGDLKGALEILKRLVNIKPESTKLSAVLANTYWDLKHTEKALEYFKKTTSLAPKLEEASLGLFHCLWDQGRKEEALEETKRFMSLSYSKDYEEIIREINEKM